MGLFTKVFGTYSERELKKLYPIVDKIEALESRFQKMSDSELSDMTQEFKNRLAHGETLDSILPEAFAAVREASWRVIGMKHFRVQLLGGIVLHQGRIAEMKTGEGKTLVATLPAYLNALTGEGVHIVTVNDYLARLASEWMGKVYRFMGLSVGLIVHGLTSEERRAAYEADITYGTNNEMGFDYLRDNMAIYKQNMVQRGHVFAIVDEVDSILIDEARTPLIISGSGGESSALYKQADDFVRRLRKKVYATIDDKEEYDEDIDADYVVDEKARSATLTAKGIAKAEHAFGLENYADLDNSTLSHHINQALKAYGIMKRDVDYVVKDGSVVIVDEFTGRLMYGRRYSEGLHQAIEAKEHINIAAESKTFATITFQNYFRLYGKLSGMTGTALTEAEEFGTIYSLDIVEIPTNKPMIRVDHTDAVYKNENGKNRAIIRQIQECHEKGQPILVGTISIEKSEYLSSMLKKLGIKHNVLNAKYHEKEAEIIAQAGRLGAVTISTNMAGRGTDILLGGNPETLAIADLRKAGIENDIINEAIGYAETDNEDILSARRLFREKLEEHKLVTSKEAELVKKAGGLFVLGTERHEARRIDNQLRGRSGRQGDPGESRFMIAMTDDLMRLFGSERILSMMDNLGVDEDMPIDQKILSNAIESAQKKVESRNFSIRKTVLSYDDVMNKQREIIYGQRMQVLNGENVQSSIASMLHGMIASTVSSGFAKSGKLTDHSELDEILAPFKPLFLNKSDAESLHGEIGSLTADKLTDKLYSIATHIYDKREESFGNIPGTDTPVMREIERIIMLSVVDEYWMDHIDAMQELRQGIGLRAYGQVDPLDEYKREGFEIFDAMVNGIREEVVRRIFTASIKREAPIHRKAPARQAAPASDNRSTAKASQKAPVKNAKKPGRNDPCPCGSGKKYKKCCGRFE